MYKYLTAYETLDFFGSLFNLSAEERKKRAEQLLEMVGLSHAANRPVGEFSKGMTRRIGLAQAMINDPSLLILDEPTSGLDPLGCREVKDLIQLLKKRGKTVIVTSHLLSDIEDVCDRVIILYGGQIRAQGTLNELLTIEGTDRITTKHLSPAVMEKVLAALREQLSEEEFHVDHPRMSLEEFFLDVVNKAQAESVVTYGARSGGQIADYLANGGDTMEEEARKELLSQLVKEEQKVPVPAEKPVETPAVKVDTNRLDDLAGGKENAAARTEDEVLTGEQSEAIAQANAKLADILSGTDKKD